MKYKIYQIKNIRDCDYAFRSWESAEHAFNMNDYEEVYSDVWYDGNHSELLEKLWILLNEYRPLNYKGHSLSMSDIVEIDGCGYYCDAIGWRHIYGNREEVRH